MDNKGNGSSGERRKGAKVERFTDLETAKRWLLGLDDDKLASWLLKFMQTGNPSPIYLSFREMTPSEVIYRLAYSIDDKEFYRRLRHYVVDRTSRWQPGLGSNYEVLHLLVLAGYMRIIELRPLLVSLAKEGQMKGLMAGNHDLHLFLLRVLIGFNWDFDLDFIVKRDFSNPAYSPIIFRGIWTISQDGFVKAIPWVSKLFEQYVKHTGIHPVGLEAIRDYILSMGLDNFGEYLDLIRVYLAKSNVRYDFLFLTNMLSWGINLNVSVADSTYVIRWHSNDSHSSKYFESPLIPTSIRTPTEPDAIKVDRKLRNQFKRLRKKGVETPNLELATLKALYENTQRFQFEQDLEFASLPNALMDEVQEALDDVTKSYSINNVS